MKRTLTFAAMIALGTAAFAPLPALAQTSFSLTIGNAPPPPRFESVPAARHGYVWAPGYWNWVGNRHVWVGGHWERERHGYQYVGATWIQDRNGWRLDPGGWRQAGYYNDGYDVVTVAPPPPRYERVPHARPGFVWSPGHWVWRGNRYDWVGGSWMAHRPGYVYQQPAWNHRNGHWYMDQGRWVSRHDRNDRWDRDGRWDRGDRLANRDYDRDGIRDRYDRDRDNDGVRNEHDRDRDGDGVPNRRDDRPDNPRRHP